MFTATYPLNPIIQQSLHEKAKHRMFLVLLVVGCVLLLGPLTAQAQTATGAMPWESFTATIARQMCGSWVKWLAVIAVALGGVMFGLGELAGPFKRTMEIAGGFCIAVGAPVVVSLMLGSAGSGTSCGQ